MKYIFAFLMTLLSIVSSDLSAQNGYIFDPSMQPIGIKIDDATQLVVSEYTLCQSMKTRIPNVRKIDRVYREVLNAKEYLIFEFHTMDKPLIINTLSIELITSEHGQIYAAQTGITCSGSSGCTKCTGNGATCTCTGTGAECGGASSRIVNPLTKIWLAKE